MKKYILIICVLLIFIGCEKAPIDDKIQGFWMLKEFTTLEDGQLHQCERLYYSIGKYVTEISERQGPNGYGRYISLIEYKNDNTILILRDFKDKNETSGDNGINASIENLLPFGINSQEETAFYILYCNGKDMILESNYARLELEKF